MKTYIIKVINFAGTVNETINPVKVECEQITKEILDSVIQQNLELNEVLKNEPRCVEYDADGHVTNVEEIKNASYLIIVPVQ